MQSIFPTVSKFFALLKPSREAVAESLKICPNNKCILIPINAKCKFETKKIKTLLLRADLRKRSSRQTYKQKEPNLQSFT